MHQITLRVPDELAEELKRAAAHRGQSLNAWATAVLSAAVDPDLEGDEASRIRERLRRAGVLAEPSGRTPERPSPEDVARARKAAGRGRSLASIVSEERGS